MLSILESIVINKDPVKIKKYQKINGINPNTM